MELLMCGICAVVAVFFCSAFSSEGFDFSDAAGGSGDSD